jgi:hypothetical protein
MNVAGASYSNESDGGPFGALRPMRGVADVSFNADPGSGQYTVVTPEGAAAPNWYSGGGTSIGAPQWAGLLAIANAQRALAAKAPLGQPQSLLYGQVGAVPGRYAAAFNDVATGRNGTCLVCTAAHGYDLPTGLGTPNADDLLVQFAAR